MPRVLPTNENCDPDNEVCRKGDWIAKHIADCERDGLFTCDAQNDVFFSWTVDVAEDDYCQPISSKKFRCGKPGTNTRCVCSDYKIQFNECRCQYWPPEDPGTNDPAFCTGYYNGGVSGVHHWACCNNCDDNDRKCIGRTWQGGSREDYCTQCGKHNNDGGGIDKYFFNCGSCSLQEKCENHCSGPLRNLPGLCWQWLDCFKGCCLALAEQPEGQLIEFCGDNICSSEETRYSCPTDCCRKVNKMCDRATNADVCQLNCCGSPSCCLETGGKTFVSSPQTACLVLLAFLGLLLQL